jgi:hypothetical protein
VDMICFHLLVVVNQAAMIIRWPSLFSWPHLFFSSFAHIPRIWILRQFCILFIYFAVLGIEPSISCMLGKCSAYFSFDHTAVWSFAKWLLHSWFLLILPVLLCVSCSCCPRFTDGVTEVKWLTQVKMMLSARWRLRSQKTLNSGLLLLYHSAHKLVSKVDGLENYWWENKRRRPKPPVFFFFVLGIELRALCLLGNLSMTRATPAVLLLLVHFSGRVLHFCLGFGLWSFYFFLLSSWDYRCVPPRPASNLILLCGCTSVWQRGPLKSMCTISQLWKGWGQLWFVTLADPCGVNSLTWANFKLPLI